MRPIDEAVRSEVQQIRDDLELPELSLQDLHEGIQKNEDATPELKAKVAHTLSCVTVARRNLDELMNDTAPPVPVV